MLWSVVKNSVVVPLVFLKTKLRTFLLIFHPGLFVYHMFVRAKPTG
jgi:hypothetical protein